MAHLAPRSTSSGSESDESWPDRSRAGRAGRGRRSGVEHLSVLAGRQQPPAVLLGHHVQGAAFVLALDRLTVAGAGPLTHLHGGDVGTDEQHMHYFVPRLEIL